MKRRQTRKLRVTMQTRSIKFIQLHNAHKARAGVGGRSEAHHAPAKGGPIANPKTIQNLQRKKPLPHRGEGGDNFGCPRRFPGDAGGDLTRCGWR
jgi:hypothetical protein